MSHGLEKERNLNLKNNSFDTDFRGQVKMFKFKFASPKSQHDKVSVLIGKIIS